MIFNPGQFPTLDDLNLNFNVSLPIRGLDLPPNSDVSEIFNHEQICFIHKSIILLVQFSMFSLSKLCFPKFFSYFCKKNVGIQMLNTWAIKMF